jgi:hypothetical protein
LRRSRECHPSSESAVSRIKRSLTRPWPDPGPCPNRARTLCAGAPGAAMRCRICPYMIKRRRCALPRKARAAHTGPHHGGAPDQDGPLSTRGRGSASGRAVRHRPPARTSRTLCQCGLDTGPQAVPI